MKKVIRDGKVAVLFSPGFGAGWYTWNRIQEKAEQMIFDPAIVEILEKQSADWKKQLFDYASKEYRDGYFGGINELCIDWIPVGTKFYIDEYDGSEKIMTINDLPWITA
jgi:hypothetical protein